MSKYELIATTTFGIEAVCKRELIDLGFEVTRTENGKVTFLSDERGIAKANLWLRSADRVLLKLAEFKAVTFDELFDQVKLMDWHKYIPSNGKFIVNAKSVKSKLFSLRDCQKITKKAISDKLMWKYRVQWLEESGSEYSILVSILKDVVTITMDTSGVALHKRGYRIKTVEAPLKETLAASLVLLSYYKQDRTLYDMFCGSGTIPIEAAMIARNIAPGLNRDFAAKNWEFIDQKIWKEERNKAYQAIDYDAEVIIRASDISHAAIVAARENAEEAGVDDCITFSTTDFNDIFFEDDYSIIITNPPYGERLGSEETAKKIYQRLGKKTGKLKTLSKYFITSYSEFEKAYKFDCSRRRKLYNGRIETWYFQYQGPKPPLKTEE